MEYTSQKSIDLNSINYTVPDRICISDACEFGMGGLDDLGNSWRYALPEDLQGIFSINLLEFIAAILTIKMVIRNKRKDSVLKILSLTDSSSALGWMYKSSFNPLNYPLHDVVARHMATNLMENNTSLYSQHISGKRNVVADSLSRDHHIIKNKLSLN